MAEDRLAKLVIHPRCAKQIAHHRNTEESFRVLKNIENTIEEEESFVILDEQDPRKIPAELREYDIVEVYGAMHGYCLTAVDATLTIKRIKHYFADGGCF